jgi:hypothetical protein
MGTWKPGDAGGGVNLTPPPQNHMFDVQQWQLWKGLQKNSTFHKRIKYTLLKSPWPCNFKYAKDVAKF